MKSTGKPGNGSPKLDGTRLQAALLSLEIFVIVVLRIVCRKLQTKVDVFVITEGSSPHRIMASDGDTTGVLAPEHAVKGVTWELGRSELFPCTTR